MVERRAVRALVLAMQYWIDRGGQSSAEYELLRKFEEVLNAKYQLKGKHIRIHVHFIPTARDELIPALVQGAATSPPASSPSPRSACSAWTSARRSSATSPRSW